MFTDGSDGGSDSGGGGGDGGGADDYASTPFLPVKFLIG